jgi:hypothetical protein
MNSRTYAILTALIGGTCGFFIIYLFFFAQSRTVRNDVVQGILIGFGLSFVTAQLYARIKTKKVNGWTTMFGCGDPRNSFLFRAACAQVFPGPINTREEAMYWTTDVDGAGRLLSGEHDYKMHFPAGQLPPVDAFWSLTMGDDRNRFVPNPINRYAVSDRSGLVPNSDGSVDIYLQKAAPTGHESNWLPAPAGKFILWLRAYQPASAILNGEYHVPCVVETK